MAAERASCSPTKDPAEGYLKEKLKSDGWLESRKGR
jgi:hypothetical protein